MEKRKDYESSDLSVVKTIRIPKKMEEFLDKVSLEEDTKFNSIITRELEKYMLFTYKIRKFDKEKEITISSRFFELVLNCMTDDLHLIEENAYQAGKKWGKEYLFIWSKELHSKKYAKYGKLMTFIGFLDIISKYSNLFKYDIVEDKESITIILSHNYNYKYSVLIANYYKGLMENIHELADKKCKIEPMEKSIVFTFNRD
ncbi:hypothetical protein [Sulfolobus acidocaldarius]|uniref:Uncharacterized protein n=3 Tax=Sulfolobus acidocaldarius TaxID=2285 RepID=Q4J6W5_SULAC|nr:hypothetical protein [Sulfolobus acidocaldarius]AAY81466.1 hypothetical protein Saci_2180 [Sulfolobus acidocaldarius DSM 639]AGE72069.1 hypothetical protein SacN8_10615 [Sulfolobus acidocaldarius N8]ALU29745.1 hypothetical protein ATY89_07200 [Sulfolobus acidocaldarius]ALU32482.1 hypothetical protein ATZ20_10220 [Sulfolobus acidocaldarius]WCM33843.1 hypothetical protein GO597_00065 [Sulfolobus acidocaldarius DSM 639]